MRERKRDAGSITKVPCKSVDLLLASAFVTRVSKSERGKSVINNVESRLGLGWWWQDGASIQGFNMPSNDWPVKC